MENLALASSPRLILGYSSQNPRDISYRHFSFEVSLLRRTNRSAPFRPRYNTVSAFVQSKAPRLTPNFERLVDKFASISSSGETSSVAANPQLSLPPSPSHVGSPLFWIGVGVGLSALFSIVATNVKKYAMQQVFKTVMGGSQNNQFDASAFSSGGSQFPFPADSAFGSASSVTSQHVGTVDVPATKVETNPSVTGVKDAINPDVQAMNEQKKYAFVDVSPEETSLRSPFKSEVQSETSSSKNGQFSQGVSPNGAVFKQVIGDSGTIRKSSSGLSVEALEKMMEDPTVQKMVYPYLPEEMRNPTTFKWMLQNPQYRQQLEEMLNNMNGSGEWDNRMTDTLKNFDISSPEVKQQFDQIGLTPEQVITKIMANPEVAVAFQNPRVQAAIMDCSQNPSSIAKYQNDREVMDVFNKISELFPGVTGSP